MTDLLFLAHRIPYPPDKGDKIRSWHLLSHLTRRFTVHLGCFVDDDADWCHVDRLRRCCESVCVVPLRPWFRRFYSIKGLMTGEAMTFAYFQSSHLMSWAERMRAKCRPVVEFAFSSAMAPYLGTTSIDRLRIVDFVDLDSDKWRQYADGKSPLLARLYRQEAHRLAMAEGAIAEQVDLSLFVSSAEATKLRERWPSVGDRVHSIENGVNSYFFDPDGEFDTPDNIMAGGPALVFTGAMDYWPNIDAIRWFALDVLPLIHAERSDVRLLVVGAKPALGVRELSRLPNVIVTGRVPDIRPWLAAADIVVAPLRIACGVQNKVLEGMAMAKPVVCTSLALKGLAAEPGTEVVIADTLDAITHTILRLLGDAPRRQAIGEAARQRVIQRYRWENCFVELDQLIDDHLQLVTAAVSKQ